MWLTSVKRDLAQARQAEDRFQRRWQAKAKHKRLTTTGGSYCRNNLSLCNGAAGSGETPLASMAGILNGHQLNTLGAASR
jgi:hypothetical protein